MVVSNCAADDINIDSFYDPVASLYMKVVREITYRDGNDAVYPLGAYGAFSRPASTAKYIHIDVEVSAL